MSIVSFPANEALLITKMSEGSQQAFEELYYLYSSAIRNNISKLIKDSETINDLMQEVFITLWQNKEKIDADKGIAPWLYTVSYNKSLKHLRRKVKEELTESKNLDLSLFVDDSFSENEYETKLPLIYEAIEQLPERKRLAFYQYRIKGKPLTEVADEMGITKDAVKGYLKDARKFILEYIESHHPTLKPITILFLICLVQ